MSRGEGCPVLRWPQPTRPPAQGNPVPIPRAFRFSLVLLAALFAPTANASVTLEPNSDRLGADYKSFALDAPDAQACRQACNDDATCKAYTYAKPGVKGAQAMCYLKQAAPPAVANDCCTSGTRVPIKLPPLMPFPITLRTLAAGPGAAPMLPAVAVPSDLAPGTRQRLAGGKDAALFVHLSPARMSVGGRATMHFIGPDAVWAGGTSAQEPNLAAFPANSDDRSAEVHLTLTPGAPRALMLDCKVSSTHDAVVYIVSERSGAEQLFNARQRIGGHLLFRVDSPGTSYVTISADQPWNFHSCEVRSL